MEKSDLVISTLRKLMRAVDLQSRQLAKTYGLTGPQIHILNAVSAATDCSVGEIARRSNMSQATVTAILDRLEKRGMIVRRRNADDKRRVDVCLTAEGSRFMISKPAMLQDQFLKKFDAIDEWEKDMILAALGRLADMLEARDLEAPPVLASGPLEAGEEAVRDFLD